MYVPRNPNRPPLPERHAHFLDVSEIRESIKVLEVVLRETNSEKVARVIDTLNSVVRNELAVEDAYREEELQEFWSNPGAYPEVVRSWFFKRGDGDPQ